MCSFGYFALAIRFTATRIVSTGGKFTGGTWQSESHWGLQRMVSSWKGLFWQCCRLNYIFKKCICQFQVHPSTTNPPPSAPQAFHFLPPNFVLRFITYRVKGLVPSSVTEAIKDVDPTHFVSPPPLKWTCKIYVIKKAFDVIQFKNSGFHKQFSIHISELFQYFSL